MVAMRAEAPIHAFPRHGLQTEQPACPLLTHALRDALLAAHRLDAHHCTTHVEQRQRLCKSRDLVALGVRGKLAQHQLVVREPCVDLVQVRLSHARRPAHRLAVDRDQLARRRLSLDSVQLSLHGVHSGSPTGVACPASCNKPERTGVDEG